MRDWHRNFFQLLKKNEVRQFIFALMIIASNSNAQYKVEWKVECAAVVSLTPLQKKVVAGFINGKAALFNGQPQAISSNSLGLFSRNFFEKNDNIYYVAKRIKKLDAMLTVLSNDSIRYGPVLESEVRQFCFDGNYLYGMHDWRFLTKHRLNGEMVWQIIVGERATNIRIATGKNSIYLYSNLGLGNNVISRYDTSGTLIWRKQAGSFVDQLLADNEGNFYLTGAGAGQYVTIKFDENANQIWMNLSSIKTSGGTFYGDSLVLCGGDYKEGKTVSSLLILSVKNGNTIAEHHVDLSTEQRYGEFFNHAVFVNNDFYCSGIYGTSANGDNQPFLVKLTDSRYVGIKETIVAKDQFTIFPNPSSSVFMIRKTGIAPESLTVSVTDSFGRLIFEEQRQGLEEEFDIDLGRYVRGIYLLELRSGENVAVQKIVLR